jgi:hypothetical protein
MTDETDYFRFADNSGVRNFSRELSRALSRPRCWRHQVVRAIVDDQLAVVLAAVLDGGHPDRGVVRQSIPKRFRGIVQTRVALLLNHLRSVRDGLFHELHHVGLGLELVARRIVAFTEVRPEVRSRNSPDEDEILAAAWSRLRANVRSSFCNL